MSAEPHPEALSVAFNRAIAEHFGSRGAANVEEVLIAGCTVVASYIAAVADPVSRGALLAQAQWLLGRSVDETARADDAKAGGRRGA